MDAVTDPMEIAIAEDGRVFLAERAGAVKMWDPKTGKELGSLEHKGYQLINNIIRVRPTYICLESTLEATKDVSSFCFSTSEERGRGV